MPTLDFPTLSKKPDGESFKLKVPNPAKEPEDTDGGYSITRPKYTRKPPLTFTFAFKDISQADRDTLLTFWREIVKGSSVAFNFRDPTNGVLHNVRFGKGYELEFKRVGFGSNHRYDTNDIVLTEV